MIMEPMAESTIGAREGMERSKFRSGLRGRETGLLGKRKRIDDDDTLSTVREQNMENGDVKDPDAIKKKKTRGPKGPNPLSVKKSKKASETFRDAEPDDYQGFEDSKTIEERDVMEKRSKLVDVVEEASGDTRDYQSKRKRKRKHRSRQIEGLGAFQNDDQTRE